MLEKERKVQYDCSQAEKAKDEDCLKVARDGSRQLRQQQQGAIFAVVVLGVVSALAVGQERRTKLTIG